MYTIDIDTGGTFTDGYVCGGDSDVCVKVETTPHDLTVCFFSCIEEGAKRLGLETQELLEQTDVIRFSSTIATNTAVQLSGPKLGVIVTKGAENNLYSEITENPIKAFVLPQMVVGITEETNGKGDVVRQPNPEDLDECVRILLENGARTLVISLQNAHLNPANEMAIRGAIDSAYPRHYLGAVPMLVSHHVSRIPNDELRTNTAIVNAYFHRGLVNSLYKAEDQVRKNGYRYPLLIVTADYGVARVAKTRAINTYQSGPAAGVRGTHVLAGTVGHDRVLSVDVGGTTSDVSLIAKGAPVTADYLPINGVQVAQRIPKIVSFGVGGGSIIRLDSEGEITVGPDSQGAVPGPAAFGLGGFEVTPTDVWLTLGYLSPTEYLGGRKTLEADKAQEVIQKKLAEPMNTDSIRAALLAKEAIEQELGRQISDQVPLPEGVSLQGATLYAFGGGAGLLAAGLAKKLKLPQVYIPAFGAVFSAFGASTLDVTHVYEEIYPIANGSADNSVLSEIISNLKSRASRDMRGEGFSDEEMSCSLDVDCLAGMESVARETAPFADNQVPPELEQFVSDLPSDSQYVIVRLTATCSVAHPDVTVQGSKRAGKIKEAQHGTRKIQLLAEESEVPVYALDRLPIGFKVGGPVVVENEYTSILVPDETTFEIDQTGNGLMEIKQ